MAALCDPIPADEFVNEDTVYDSADDSFGDGGEHYDAGYDEAGDEYADAAAAEHIDATDDGLNADAELDDGGTEQVASAAAPSAVETLAELTAVLKEFRNVSMPVQHSTL